MEASVAQRLDRARAEGAAVVERAIADAADYTRRSNEALESALAEMDARQASALLVIDQEVSQAAEALIAYYRGLPRSEVARLADAVISEVSGLCEPIVTAGPGT
jgi:hypothetical protein